jgi:tripartite-type tricarboxylate transporter receptor subunit TctC
MHAGNLKAYAVTGNKRLAQAPDLPTFAEMGFPALSYSTWGGLFAPRGTSADAMSKLRAAAVEAVADSLVRSRLMELGFEIFPRQQQTSEILGALVKSDAEKWWPIIRELKIRAE